MSNGAAAEDGGSALCMHLTPLGQNLLRSPFVAMNFQIPIVREGPLVGSRVTAAIKRHRNTDAWALTVCVG